MANSEEVHLFWDNSNIFISAQQVVLSKEPEVSEKALRIHFSNLDKLALAGRSPGGGLMVSSSSSEKRDHWERMQNDISVECRLLERGEVSGTEQGVDETLQAHMLRAGMDNLDGPGIAVLLTGDGEGLSRGVGFHADMERLYKNGWGIEVLAWDVSCNRELKEWAKEVGVYVPLEDYYEAVTFVEGGRMVDRLNWTRRPKARPGVPRHTDKINALEKEMEELRKELDPRKKHEKRLKNRGELNNRKPRKKQRR